MTTTGLLVLATAVGVTGLLVAMAGWVQPAPPLHRALARLDRGSGESAGRTGPAEGGSRRILVARAVGVASRHPSLMPTPAQLAVVGRSPEQHTVSLLLGSAAGFVLPVVILTLLQASGVVGLGWFVPVAGSSFGAVVAPVAVHAAVVGRAERELTDLRFQVSAYLDVVTMLLAGNSGYEGALDEAARAGDGRLFVELRRRMRDAGARGASLTEALHRTGTDLGLDELEQVAAIAALSAAEGAPVARTLAAKCATLRSALASEHESEARLRTSRLTTPIVGMALIFMALVIFPALSFV